MKKNINKNKRGFSLIETMIAVSILMIAIAGPLSLVQAGLFSSTNQRNQVTATYLVQEAFEYIKNIRDANSYAQYSGIERNWLTGPDGNLLIDTCGGSGCYVDPHVVGAFVGSASDVDLLNRVTNASGVVTYSYAGGTPSIYKRTVVIEGVGEINPDTDSYDEVRVTVTVSWKDRAVDREYVVRGNIYNYEQ